MPLVFDRVKELSTSTGTGTFSLNGAVPGFQAFDDVFNLNDTFYYSIAADNGSWETGTGTYISTNTIERTTVFESSNGGSLVGFSAGSKDVFVTYPAKKSITTDTAVALSIALG